MKFSTACFVRNVVSSDSVRLSIVGDDINVILRDKKKVKPIISLFPIFTEIPLPNLVLFFWLRYRLTALMLFVYIWSAAKEARQIGKIYINTFFSLWFWRRSTSIEILWRLKHCLLLVCPKLTIHQFFTSQEVCHYLSLITTLNFFGEFIVREIQKQMPIYK